MPAPLQRPAFRQLWLGMTTSYAGDRLQFLAQAWLVATLTNSALAVGLIAAAGSVPQLLLPLGGVVAEQVDRSRLLIAGQLLGALSTAIVAILVVSGLISPWHIYAWAFLAGSISLVCRPAYKVVLTESVPEEEVRPAVALNSVSETSSSLAVNALGSLLLALVGLPIAFLLNVVSYLVAAFSLLGLRSLDRRPHASKGLTPGRLLPEVADGLVYLLRRPALLHPLLLTLATVAVAGPLIGLLAAIVRAGGGSIVALGMLGVAFSVGSLGGAIFAGARSEGGNPTRAYALRGLIAALAVAAFALLPLGLLSAVPLAIVGFVAFSAAVWNTSRVRRLASDAYQARLQAITSMAFDLGMPVGVLWAGVAIDRFGLIGLLGGAVMLGAVSAAIALTSKSED